jgi:hypothetical protein
VCCKESLVKLDEFFIREIGADESRADRGRGQRLTSTPFSLLNVLRYFIYSDLTRRLSLNKHR